MFTTLYMGLDAWDQGGDPYNHSQLANNFVAIAGHRHIEGEGRQIPTGGIESFAITTPKVAPNAITPDKIPDYSLTEIEHADDSVSRRMVQASAIGTEEIENRAIKRDKIDIDFLPPGAVISWWRPNSVSSVPLGWEILDGRSWAGIPNYWGLTSGNMPNLTNRFVLGAATTGTGSGTGTPPIQGQLGGSHTRDFRHDHNIPSTSIQYPTEGVTDTREVGTNASTDSSLGDGRDMRPAYIGLLYIMRVL